MLDRVEIKAGVDTPYVLLDPLSLSCEISGKSYPPDVLKFYEPVIEWLDDFRYMNKDKLVFSFKLDYYNTATSKIILELLYVLEEFINDGIQVNINWYYPDDDEEMLEIGEEYERLVSVPFNHIGYSKRY